MPELVMWPQLERVDDPFDPVAEVLEPVEIRFQIRPEVHEEWARELAVDCSVEGRRTPNLGASLSFPGSQSDTVSDLYCYVLSRNLHQGDTLKLRVRPPKDQGPDASNVLWEKEFKVGVEEGRYQLEEP